MTLGRNSIASEELAYWYFRLNGFLTTMNFVVHSEAGGGQRTDVDILGVRFPFRAELLDNSMTDDNRFTQIADKPFIVIVEVKRSICCLNGPWTFSEKENINRVLRALGAFKTDKIDDISTRLYEKGFYDDENYHLTLCCVGNEINSDLQKKYPDVPQVLWNDILKFIYDRFEEYRDQKIDHPQWDDTAKSLWDHQFECKSRDKFVNSIIKCLR